MLCMMRRDAKSHSNLSFTSPKLMQMQGQMFAQ